MAWWSVFVEPLKQVLIPIAFEGIKWVGGKIMDWLSGSSKSIGNTDSYDADTASSEQTKQLNDALAEFKNLAIEYGEKLENDFLQSGKVVVEKLIEQIKQVDFVNMDDLKKQCDDILHNFQGTIAKNIISKMSLKNEDFLEIVGLVAGDEKRQKALAFCESVAQDAFSKAADSFAENLSSSVKSVMDLLNVKLQSEQTIIKNAQSTLDKIKNAQKQEQKQQEQVNLSLDLCKKEALLTKMGN